MTYLVSSVVIKHYLSLAQSLVRRVTSPLHPVTRIAATKRRSTMQTGVELTASNKLLLIAVHQRAGRPPSGVDAAFCQYVQNFSLPTTQSHKPRFGFNVVSASLPVSYNGPSRQSFFLCNFANCSPILFFQQQIEQCIVARDCKVTHRTLNA